jgi:hypothetical protein
LLLVGQLKLRRKLLNEIRHRKLLPTAKALQKRKATLMVPLPANAQKPSHC